VQFNSTPDALEMAFKANRNMPFSLVLQKLSSFQASIEIFSILCYFVAIILKVLLVNLLAALNFANVFKNKKTFGKYKNVKNVKT